jgi:dTDP-4-amino-4,6-dideoxygalactose transaminase
MKDTRPEYVATPTDRPPIEVIPAKSPQPVTHSTTDNDTGDADRRDTATKARRTGGGQRDLIAWKDVSESIPITSPYTPGWDVLQDRISSVLETGMLTNSRFVREFEKRMAEYLEAEEAVAVSNCTTGLIMTLSVLGLTGEILVPSFTFSATGHVCYWTGLKPVFVDCDGRDWTIQLSDCIEATGAAAGERVSSILAVHTFGNPADVDALEQFARDQDLVLLFDAAHAVGSTYKGRRLGAAGKASVFSLTPTKIITSGEGGIIATDDRSLAGELRVFRNYGDDGSYDCGRVGLNGRMSELNAILGLATLDNADDEVEIRNEYAAVYAEELAGIPGMALQAVRPDCRSSYKDFTVVVDETRFGTNRDQLGAALGRENVATRKYFDPPLHRQTAYRNLEFRRTGLRNTDSLSKCALTLPMYSGMGTNAVKKVCESIRSYQRESARNFELSVKE